MKHHLTGASAGLFLVRLLCERSIVIIKGMCCSFIDIDQALCAEFLGVGEELLTALRVGRARIKKLKLDIFIHNFEDGGDHPATVDVTIRTDDETITLGIETAALDVPCALWKVGSVEWPARVFTPGANNPPARCYPGGAP